MHDLYQSRENIQNLVHTPLTLPNDSSIGKQVKSKISGQSRSLILPEEHLLVPFLTHICLCFESCSCCCTSMTSPFQVFLVSSKLQWRNSQTYQIYHEFILIEPVPPKRYLPKFCNSSFLWVRETFKPY